MMTQRRVVTLLIAALVIVAVAFALASRRPAAHQASAGQPLLEGLKPVVNEVTELRISKGDGSRVTLKKRESDWVVAERDYPADSGRVRKLLLNLSALSVIEEKTSDPTSYSRIGVEDVKTPAATGARIEAVTPKKTYAVIVGRSSGMKNTFVRVADAKASYLATPQVMPDADPKRWLDRTLTDILEARVKEIEIAPASGPAYKVSREKKEQTDFTVSNIPKGRELSSPGAANGTAGELVSLTLDDVRKPPSADAKPDATATFHTFDGLDVQVTGYKDGERRYVSFVPKSTAKETEAEAQTLTARVMGWQFEIPNYKYDQFFKPLEELLKKPEPKPDAKDKGAKKKPAAPAPAAPPTS